MGGSVTVEVDSGSGSGSGSAVEVDSGSGSGSGSTGPPDGHVPDVCPMQASSSQSLKPSSGHDELPKSKE